MPSIAMQSHTGSGKTLAYLIPIFCDILRKKTWRRWTEIKRGSERRHDDYGHGRVGDANRENDRNRLGPYGRDITQQLIEAQTRGVKRV